MPGLKSTAKRVDWFSAQQKRRDTLWLPDWSLGTVWAIDTIRALLVEKRIKAWDAFVSIIEAARPSIEASMRRARGDNKWALRWIAGRRRLMKRAMDGKLPLAADGFDLASIKQAKAFSKKWLNHL